MKINNPRSSNGYQMHSCRFALDLLAYALVSEVLFALTIGGWLLVIIAYFSLFFWPILILFTYLGLSIRYYKFKKNQITINLKDIKKIFTIQLILYAFITDNCGSPFILTFVKNFLEIFFSKKNSVAIACKSEYISEPIGYYFLVLGLIILALYVCFLIAVIIRCLLSEKESSGIPNS